MQGVQCMSFECEKCDQSPNFTLLWDNMMRHTAVQPSLHLAIPRRIPFRSLETFEIGVPFPGEPGV